MTGQAVLSSDKGRGYEVGENQYLLVEDREIEQARQVRPEPDPSLFIEQRREEPKRAAPRLVPVEEPEDDTEDEEPEESAHLIARPQNNHTIEIEKFLPVGQVDARYHDKPYYIVPRESVGQEAFAVIREAMRLRPCLDSGASCCPRASNRSSSSRLVMGSAA